MAHSFKSILWAPDSKKWPRGQQPRMRTDFLFPMPNFWYGLGSVLDLGGSIGPFSYSRSGKEADFKAIYSDYRMIGQDIEDAMRVLEAEHKDAFPAQSRLFDPEETEHAS